MDAETKGDMVAGIGAIKNQGIGVIKFPFIPIARGLPHGDFIPLADGFTVHFDVFQGGASHIG